MSNIVKSCSTCAHHKIEPITQGVSICNLFHKYSMVARHFSCVNNQYWEQIKK